MIGPCSPCATGREISDLPSLRHLQGNRVTPNVTRNTVWVKFDHAIKDLAGDASP